MPKLINYKFTSFVDNNLEMKFQAKGYKDIKENQIVYYFKHDDSYKFIYENEYLEIHFNDSIYIFNVSKETTSNITIDNYTLKAKIHTKKLEISANKILVEYAMIFSSFKNEHLIILELYSD